MSIQLPYLKARWMELEFYETEGPSGRWQLFLSSCIWQFPSFKIDAAPVFFRLHTGKRPHIYECLAYVPIGCHWHNAAVWFNIEHDFTLWRNPPMLNAHRLYVNVDYFDSLQMDRNALSIFLPA